MVSVRYMVDDVAAAVAFYRDALGFSLKQQFGPAMAILEHGELQLWLAGPQSSAAKPMPGGVQPLPGGWNRFVLEVADLPALVTELRSRNIVFRNDILDGPGGRQILCEDHAGNVVELFQPR